MYSSGSSGPQCSSADTSYQKSCESSPLESPNKLWFHGEMGAFQAESLLEGSAPGLFLIRRQGARRYYLSFVNHAGSITHNPVRHINSSFFFMGQRFPSLADVVDFFEESFSSAYTENPTISLAFCSTPMLQKNERDQKFLCMKTNKGTVEDELRTYRGDIITVLERTEDGTWLWGRNEATRMIGLIPIDILQPLVSLQTEMGDLPFFYDTISTDAVQPLPLGSFLLRRSTKGDNAYALLVKTQPDLVEKFLILGSPQCGFMLSGRPFHSIGHVIERYTTKAISGGLCLSHAVIRSEDDDEGSFSLHGAALRQLQDLRNGNLSPSCYSVGSDGLSVTKPQKEVEYTTPELVFSSFDDKDISPSRTVIESCQALRKSREEKQWKSCWIKLSDYSNGDSRLSITDNKEDTKSRLEYDLSCTKLFWLDESVFGVEGSFFLSLSLSQPSTFLCFQPLTLFVHWISLLRTRQVTVQPALPRPLPPLEEARATQLNLLFLDLDKFKSDLLKTENVYSANVLLDNVRVCSSNSFAVTSNRQPTELPVVVFDSRFVLPYVPCDARLQLSLLSSPSNTKKGRVIGVSKLVSLSTEPICFSQDAGFVYRAQQRAVRVFPSTFYAPLVKILRKSPETLLRQPSSALPLQHRTFLYSCLVFLYLSDSNAMVEMFRNITKDALAASTTEDVFRKDSVATGVVTQCLRHSLKSDLDEYLQTAPQLCNAHNSQLSKTSVNVDAASCVVEFLTQTLEKAPLALQVLAAVAECAAQRFPEQPHIVRRSLSAILVLRFLNPILLTSMTGAGPLAKAIQKAANAAASTLPQEELTSTSATFRRLFDRIAGVSSQVTGESKELSTEWLAMVAHMLALSYSSSERVQLPEEVAALVDAHRQ
ncbi:unnamed protein product [Caenorhabditis auriculariae]|uniref:SH2 domain-containing protein n=1 Tax=Caenorhabditis auriculariae TaxID=2777116 RepID=A0A8S1H6E1_9PELO|nr:unnamed protein product [Caenorhabditis auriculariae]